MLIGALASITCLPFATMAPEGVSLSTEGHGALVRVAKTK